MFLNKNTGPKKRKSVYFSPLRVSMGVATCFCLFFGAPQFAEADDSRVSMSGMSCSKIARVALKAGRNEARDDFWIGYGKCLNLSDYSMKKECLGEVRGGYAEAKELVHDQLDARMEVCDDIGEEPFDPQIDPADFVDFRAVVNGQQTFIPQPYFPLVPGAKLIYIVKDEEGNKLERIKVEVLAEVKEILGVNCIVVRDRVWEIDEEGERTLIEDTFDWYAQDNLGNVWYFGEIARNYEDGELVDLEGSWKAGRDYDMPGFIMPADAQAGDVYRQEFSLGNAEDMGEVIGYIDSMSVNGKTYTNVLKTMDYTPVEPEAVEFKYYAPDIGVILEENPGDGERLELIRAVFP